MGLLDSLGITGPAQYENDAITNGLLALAATGRQRPFLGLLQGLAAAQGTMNAGRDKDQARALEALKMKLLEAEVGDTQAQEVQRRAAAAQADKAQAALQGLLGTPGAANQYGAEGSGISLGGMRERMVPQGGGLQSADPNALAAYLAMPGANSKIADIWTKLQEGFKRDPGAAYMDPVTKKLTFTPDLKTGITSNDGGQSVSLIPGALAAQSALARGNKEAEQQAINRNTLFQGVGADGTPQPLGTVADIQARLAANSPLRPQQRTAVDPMSMAQAEAVSSGKPVQFNLGGRTGTISPSGDIGQSPAIRTGLGPADTWTADTERGVMRNGLGQTKPMTNQDGNPIGTQKETAEAQSNNKFLAATAQARTLLAKEPTGSGVGTMYDNVAGFFGAAPKGSVPAQQLRAVSGWLTSNVPRMEGPQSNYDVQNYREMAATVGDSTKPVAIRLAALDEAEKLIRKYSDLNKAQPANPGPAAQKPQRSLDDLLKQYGN